MPIFDRGRIRWRASESARQKGVQDFYDLMDPDKYDVPEWCHGVAGAGESHDIRSDLVLTLDVGEMEVRVEVSERDMHEFVRAHRDYDGVLLVIGVTYTPERIVEKSFQFIAKERRRWMNGGSR